mgnify:CR=1 FL=1
MPQFKDAAALLPRILCGQILKLPADITDKCEEIRLRTGRPLSLLYDGCEREVIRDWIISLDDIEAVIEKATDASIHSVECNISKGYLSTKGGIRIGLCGEGFYKDKGIFGLRSYSSLAIRIPHEISDCGTDKLRKAMENGLCDLIIISPPGAGKTSCLREYVRNISNSGYRVSLIDERNELSGMVNGVAQFDVGSHTDILLNIPKPDAAMMMLRAMNPQLVAMDEISSGEDVKAVEEIAGCGVKILATAHAASVSDLSMRPIYKRLFDMKIFRYAVIIENNNGVRTYKLEEL